MLPWQPKKLSRKIRLFAEIVALSALLHAILFFFFFVIFRGKHETFHLEISKSGNKKQIVFVPSCLGIRANNNKTTSMPNKSKAVQPVVKKAAPVPAKKVVQQKPVVQNKGTTLKSPSAKKQPAKPPAKKPVVKKTPPPKKEVPAKKEVAKPAPKPVPVPVLQPVPLPQPEVEQAKQLSASNESVSVEESYDEDVIYVPLDIARMYCALQEEISAQWKPPVGLSKDLECQVAIHLAPDGAVIHAKVNQSSGVLVYDVAARSAVRKINFPRWAFGKEFTIAFKQ